MFRIGERYIIHLMIDGAETECWNRIVVDFSEKTGLLKVSCGNEIEIINTTSPNFIKAKLQN